MFLETFINGVNEFAFAIGYTAIIACVAYGTVTIVKGLINRKSVSE